LIKKYLILIPKGEIYWFIDGSQQWTKPDEKYHTIM